MDNQKWMDDLLPIAIGATVLFCMIGLLASMAYSEPIYSTVAICDSIYRAEGGAKAQYLYGIRSVHYRDVADARSICMRTIRHARKDWRGKEDFITFLGNRYCPVQCNKINKNWVGNVRWFLNHRAVKCAIPG